MARFRIDVGGSTGTPDRSRNDGVNNTLVTLTSLDSASTHTFRIVTSTDDSPPTVTATGATTATFTPVNGPNSYLIELETTGPDETVRRTYRIPATNTGLLYPTPNEGADPTATLQTVSDPNLIAASNDNEGGNVFGWADAATSWFEAVDELFTELAVPASSDWALTQSSSDILRYAQSAQTLQAALPFSLAEQASPPTAVASRGHLYTANAGGNTELFYRNTSTTVQLTGAGSAEANTASNLGTGAEVFAQKTGVDLEFRSLIGGTDITLVQSANDITINWNPVALGQLADVNLTGVAQGDILYRNAVNEWVNLPPGAPGQFLETQGPGARPQWNTLPASGETNTASNLGAGAEVFAQKTGADLEFRSLVGGTGVSITQNANDITIDRDAIALGDLSDVDTTGQAQGAVLYRNASEWVVLAPGTSGQFLQTAGAGANPVWANAPAPGETNTASNLGTGEGVFASKTGVDLEFKSLVAGTNITLSSTATEITIDASGSGAGTLQDAYDNGNTIALTAGTPVEITAASATDAAIDVQTGVLEMPTAIGIGSTLTLGSGANVVALGTETTADANQAVGIGWRADAGGTNAVAIGREATVDAGTDRVVAVGANTIAYTDDSIVIGQSSTGGQSGGTAGIRVIAIGSTATATENTAIAIGAGTNAAGTDAIAFGTGASAESPSSIAIGDSAAVPTSAGNSIAIGLNTDATGTNAVAIGAGAQATATESVALGPSVVSGGSAFGAVDADVSGSQSICIGNGTSDNGSDFVVVAGSGAIVVDGNDGIALGRNTQIGDASNTATASVAVGLNASALSSQAVAIGNGAVVGASSIDGVAIGRAANAAAGDAIAIGTLANANLSSIAIGEQAVAAEAETICIGRLARTSTTGSSTRFGIVIGDNASISDVDAGIALGRNATVRAIDSIAIGFAASVEAVGTGKVAIGNSATAGANKGIAIGEASTATAGTNDGIAVGRLATSRGAEAIAFGHGAATGTATPTDANYAIAVGGDSSAEGEFSVAIGRFAAATGSDSFALGRNAAASDTDAIAIGHDTTADGTNALAISPDSNATGTRAIAIGGSATADNAITIGNASNAAENTIVLGQVTAAVTTTDVNAVLIGTSINFTAADAAVIIGNATSGASRAVSIGRQADADSTGNVAVGNESFASGASSVAVGLSADSLQSGTAIGSSAANTGTFAVAVGTSAIANTSGVAIGESADAAVGGIALGRGATAPANQCMIGGQAGGGILQLYLGRGETDSAPAAAVAFRATSASVASGANGSTVQVIPGAGDGAGNDGVTEILLADGTTNGLTVNADGAIGVGSGPVDFGTSGQVLTSRGAGLSPEWTTVSGGGGGEANTAINLGSGEGVFAQKNGVDLEFKSLTAGAGLSITSTSSEIAYALNAGLNDLSDVSIPNSTALPVGSYQNTSQSPSSNLEVADSAALQVNQSYSVSFWMRSSAQIAALPLVGKGINLSGEEGWNIGTNWSAGANGTFWVEIESTFGGMGSSTYFDVIAQNDQYRANEWTHHVFVVDYSVTPPTCVVYSDGGSGASATGKTVNGSLAGASAVAPNRTNNTQPLRIGGGSGFYSGSSYSVTLNMADVAVWDGTLSASDAAALYNGGSLLEPTAVSGLSASLLYYYPIRDATTLADQTGNAAALTAQGTMAPSVSAPPALGTSVGSILYQGSANWVPLTPGTAGQILETQGAGSAPQWVSMQEYAGLAVAGNTTATPLTGSNYEAFANFTDQMASNGATSTLPDVITIGSAGDYLVTYHVHFTTPPGTADAGVEVTGVVAASSVARSARDPDSDTLTIAGSVILTLASTDVVRLAVRDPNATTPSVTISHAGITVTKVG